MCESVCAVPGEMQQRGQDREEENVHTYLRIKHRLSK